MRSFFNSSKFIRTVFSIVLFTFSFWSITSIYAFDFPIGIDVVDDVKDIHKIEKIASKIKKACKKGDLDESIKLMFEFKKKLEDFGDVKISIDESIKEVDKELRKEGIKLSNGRMSYDVTH